MSPAQHHLLICLSFAHTVAALVVSPWVPRVPFPAAARVAGLIAVPVSFLLISGALGAIALKPPALALLAALYILLHGLTQRTITLSWQGFVGYHASVFILLVAIVALSAEPTAVASLTDWPPRLRQALVLLVGLILIWEGGSQFVRHFTYPLRPAGADGAAHAGARIGQLERLLVIGMILSGYMEGIGFVLGAKLVFRIGEMSKGRHVRQTEYILVGTLASFAWAMLVGLGVKRLLLWAE